MKKQSDMTDIRLAVAPNTGPAGALTGIAVDGTGFSRARFIFNFGANAGTVAVSSGIGVWNASTSGATYSLVGSLAAVTSGALGSNLMVVDVPIAGASPWMKVSGGSILTGPITNSCVVELYNPISRAPSATPSQVVTI